MTGFMPIIAFILGVVLGLGVKILIDRSAGSSPSSGTEPDPALAQNAPQSIYQLAADLSDFYNSAAHPKDLLASSEFMRGPSACSATMPASASSRAVVCPMA